MRNIYALAILCIFLTCNTIATATQTNNHNKSKIKKPSYCSSVQQAIAVNLPLFYSRPTFRTFNCLLTDITKQELKKNLSNKNKNHKNKNNDNKEKNLGAASSKITDAFFVMALNANTKFANNIRTQFASYSKPLQEKLLGLLSAAGYKKTASEIKLKHKVKESPSKTTVTQIKNIDLEKITSKQQVENLDLVWSAYFATGNSSYVKKIIQFINNNDLLLLAGYEITNREYICKALQSTHKNTDSNCPNLDDIFSTIKDKYPHNYQEKMTQATAVSAALWSISNNEQRDPTLRKKIKKIIKQNPNLDYWKKINKSLKSDQYD